MGPWCPASQHIFLFIGIFLIIFPFLQVSPAFIPWIGVLLTRRDCLLLEWGACSLDHYLNKFVSRYNSASSGIRTWDLSLCLYLNLKHDYLDCSAPMDLIGIYFNVNSFLNQDILIFVVIMLVILSKIRFFALLCCCPFGRQFSII